MAEEFVCTPMKPIATPPSDNKGGPGVYNGEDGLPKRTSSPNAAPEKVRDGSIPNMKPGPFPASSE